MSSHNFFRLPQTPINSPLPFRTLIRLSACSFCSSCLPCRKNIGFSLLSIKSLHVSARLFVFTIIRAYICIIKSKKEIKQTFIRAKVLFYLGQPSPNPFTHASAPHFFPPRKTFLYGSSRYHFRAPRMACFGASRAGLFAGMFSRTIARQCRWFARLWHLVAILRSIPCPHK